jgi:hypothetical protein
MRVYIRFLDQWNNKCARKSQEDYPSERASISPTFVILWNSGTIRIVTNLMKLNLLLKRHQTFASVLELNMAIITSN